MPINTFSVGRDCQLVVMGPYGRVDLSHVTGFESRQVTAAVRGHDGGSMGMPMDTGYTRLIAAPGLEVSYDRVRAYAEVGLAIYNNMSGNQLIARQMYKLSVSYAF